MDDVAQVVELFSFDDGFGAESVVFEPVFVLGMQLLNVRKRNGHFGFTAAAFDAPSDTTHGAAQINEQIRRLKFRADRLIKLHIGVVIALGDAAPAMEIFDKDFGILIDGTIQNDALIGFLGFEVQCEFARQIKDLRIEGPSLHVLVEIRNIGIVVHGFVERMESKFAR